ncbi:MAG: leucyl aminopeptidase [Cryomorphaceae bacterium]|nr:leucyl aminopeptidase [Cryomorphaceae bacterium]
MLQQHTKFGAADKGGVEIIAFSELSQLATFNLSEDIKQKAEKFAVKNDGQYFYQLGDRMTVICKVKSDADPSRQAEQFRMAGSAILPAVKAFEEQSIFVRCADAAYGTALAEGFSLASYSFDIYKKVKSEYRPDYIGVDGAKSDALNVLRWMITGNFLARDLVNEPLIKLTATMFSERLVSIGKEVGFSVEVLNKTNIESLRMGGLLGVNKGSVDPPTFSILEYKPSKPRNTKPLILVGKGVMYDTGGLSLKPTAGSMDSMKSDMGGAAAVSGAITAIAGMKSDVWVMGLIPATDNRPGGNAITPGDILHMYDGTSVEVLNTDAEGRLILGDALAFAKKYNPDLVIDLATLTGAAVIAVGRQGICAMGKLDDKTYSGLEKAGHEMHERLVRLPLWPEYKAMLKSTVADMKNIGGREAGTITAGKFLEHFTDYPWVHLDIAAPTFLDSSDGYRPVGGTGAGVRLLTQFVVNHYAKS